LVLYRQLVLVNPSRSAGWVFYFLCVNFAPILSNMMTDRALCLHRTGIIALLILIGISRGMAQVPNKDTTGKHADSAVKHADTVVVPTADTTTLRIRNLNPFFNMHVDSVISYNLEINKDESKYYWFLRNSPPGLRINKDNGQLTMKVEKSYFLAGRLKYDTEYKVNVGVQSLDNPEERVDTFFTVIFYNTEVIPSHLKPSVSTTLTVDEGDTVSFKIQCENGTFPIENITFFANTPLKNYTVVKSCGDDFIWSPGFDFVKETDSSKSKLLLLNFVGTSRFSTRDTAVVRIVVRNALNFDVALQDYQHTVRTVGYYILQLKYTFLQLDKKVKGVKTTRTTFDLTSSTTALTGSILASSTNQDTKQIGAILPGVGVSLVPIKEAVAPQKVYDQNQATVVRAAIKRLEFMLQDNALVGEHDPDIAKKTNKLREELKQIQVQLIDVPVEFTANISEQQLNDYFNSPKVNKKYRAKK
jgi:hypothetical protein